MPEAALPAKTRRAALEVLSRDRLAAMSAKFDLTVEDRRAQAAHVDAIVRARSLDFGEVLRQLSRDELKAICDALGLDPSGKEKEAIVQRILGNQDGPATTSSTNGHTNGVQLELPPQGVKLTVDQLESHLRRAGRRRCA